MHNTNISEAYSIKTRKTIETKLLNNILKSQNKLKSFLEQKKTMTNEELDEYSKNTIDKYLSKLTQTRRFGVYGILDKILMVQLVIILVEIYLKNLWKILIYIKLVIQINVKNIFKIIQCGSDFQLNKYFIKLI